MLSIRRRPEALPDSAAVPGGAEHSNAHELRDEALILPQAAQIKRGFRTLRFEPALEQEFQEYFWTRYEFRTRVALIGGALLFALFALRDMRTLPAEVWRLTVGIRMLLIVPSILLVVALSFWKRMRRWMEVVVTVGVFIAMSGLTAIILASARMGSPLPYEGLILIMVFTIFLSGLRFYKASISILLTVAGFIGASLILGMPSAQVVLQSYYLIGIMLVGLLGSYSLELSLRANFLNEGVARFRALHDPLTKLYNRRAAWDHMDRAWRLAFRERGLMALVLVDVDHFKRFNDRYGHLMGDICLTKVSMALSDRIRRPMDIVARYGGEEFVAVVYDITAENLARLCEDLRGAVFSLAIPHADNAPHDRVTVSIGAILLRPAAGNVALNSALEQADRALYRAKEQGRNCCEWIINTAPAPAPPGAGSQIAQ